MKSRIVAVMSVAVLALGLASCNFFGESYKKVTAQDLTALSDGFPDTAKRQLAQNEEQRKSLIKRVKEAFSLALAAQAEGLDKSERYKQLMTIQTDQSLVEEQMRRLSESGEASAPPAPPTKEEQDAYLNAHKAEFDSFIKFATEGEKKELKEEELNEIKTQWASLKIRADQARKLGIEKDAAFQARMKMLRADALARVYRQSLQDKLKPTSEELKKEYADKPELDPEKVKQTAEDILKRVKAGEDFAKLAKEHSADKLSAEKGGELDYFTKDGLVKPYADAAFALQKGQTSDLVKSEFGYHIIQLLDRRTRTPEAPKSGAPTPPNAPKPEAGPVEEVKTRHILISTTASENAVAQITQKRVQRAIEDAILKYQVTAPDDFLVNVKGTRAPGDAQGLKLPDASSNSGQPAAPAGQKQ